MTLSECEILGRQPTFLPKLLNQETPSTQTIRVRDHILNRLITGCFPEPLQRASERRSQAWYQQYLSTLIQRDIRDLAHIDHPDLMGKLLKLTAFYAGKLVNLTELGGKLGLDRLTIKKYMGLLEQLFLVEQLPAWHTNEYKRLVKTPKLHSIDTGLMCAVRGLNRDRLLKQPGDFGLLLESFVYNELRKQAVWQAHQSIRRDDRRHRPIPGSQPGNTEYQGLHGLRHRTDRPLECRITAIELPASHFRGGRQGRLCRTR